tara:strand:- start:5026 stop:5961 length:936 start_codon:yes stop_codon:yes gene_type:complete
MKKHNHSGGRNYGYGKQMHYAAKQALVDRYGSDNKFGTQASHHARFKQFATWCKAQGIKDARDLNQEIVVSYANSLSEKVEKEEMAVSYAQNLISSVNVALSAMRGDNNLKISPSNAVGVRSHTRENSPISYDRSQYQLALNELSTPESKMTLVFAREFGLRLREAGLFRPKEALVQYHRTGRIDIQCGVKGGRNAPREIAITPRQVALLERAREVLGKAQCLVDKQGKYTDWKNSFYREYQASGARDLIGKFHDNRAAFACEKMKELTGKEARVINPHTPLTKKEEYAAKAEIAAMLGHGRVDVVASYTG